MELITFIRAIVSVLYLLGILPLLLGQFSKGKQFVQKVSWIDCYLWGFLTELFVFEIIYTPALLYRLPFSKFSNILIVVYAVLSILGILKVIFDLKRDFVVQVKLKISKYDLKYLLWIFPIVIIGFQVYMNIFYQYLDGDDAYYMAQSTAAFMTDHMYGFEPYTGVTSDLDMRHAMAGLPIFLAFLSRISGIHPAIMGHTVFSTFMILITYLLYARIAKTLFQKDETSAPLFLGLIALIQMFGNNTIYTSETFFLTRTSQGKAVFTGYMVPVLFLFLLNLSKRMEVDRLEKTKQIQVKKRGYLDIWFPMVLLQVAGVCCTTMSVYLVSFMLGLGLFILCIRDRKPLIFVPFFLSLIPAGFYGLLYIMN